MFSTDNQVVKYPAHFQSLCYICVTEILLDIVFTIQLYYFKFGLCYGINKYDVLRVK